MKEITLNELYAAMAEQIKKGNGNKKVLVADDDEGNGYHPIYFAVTPMEDFKEEDLACCNLYGYSAKYAKENCVIIG